LGLAIVRHLTELHGGTVHAESVGEGHGAMFTIRLRGFTPDAASAIRDASESSGGLEPNFV
jgi:signal transduction histidine kinase